MSQEQFDILLRPLKNAITSMVERFILANYNISFLYTVNDKTIYSSSGESMEDAIKTVYKSEYLGNMVKINII